MKKHWILDISNPKCDPEALLLNFKRWMLETYHGRRIFKRIKFNFYDVTCWIRTTKRIKKSNIIPTCHILLETWEAVDLVVFNKVEGYIHDNEVTRS
jgi:hypothetical protein